MRQDDNCRKRTFYYAHIPPGDCSRIHDTLHQIMGYPEVFPTANFPTTTFFDGQIFRRTNFPTDRFLSDTFSEKLIYTFNIDTFNALYLSCKHFNL